ncbi:hypothetical protein FDI11_gp27 [Mycobacterium phage Tiger]|uniref:Gp68-like predicted RNA polymerase component domain-containing protein n=2 Tax=Benedictvirus TaxID=2946819 RepID=H9ND01_9CAUD|nr:hypothetical protein X823_gp27 [Mycobacterium phage Conspiracy]YP_008859091.1 hypothetical protein X816_gp25 [Mycobacterium phage Jovo]YP_009607708.1 hypothetical protein FDI11_gp27 [Mycobacterium phage Tiger]ATW60038.1 hypothetical protein SEA_PHLORENCE_64 [Mycobacterium phage Phlorence]ATW60458.1 hypothetical protein SEA_FORGETIT_66 [Mycobacterium phage ForGetIt]ATW61011.1 hypothetical protein SEA_ARAGOG_65 [Mycobacterium phage Aragog]ATW61253.1 hypothetical protein SEA_AGENTM_65 [Mycoba
MTTTKTNFDDPAERELLYADDAPHETGGVLRMFRGGMKGPQIAKELGLPVGPQLSHAMQKALDQETYAKDRGVPIHDAGVQVA